MSRTKKGVIAAFIAAWNALFLYETLREFQLTPLVHKLCASRGWACASASLPKTPMLFPPAGWIMFYQVGDSAGGIDVYGINKSTSAVIDPHRIFATRYILFDNIRRGMMFSAAEGGRQWTFCNYLRRKFPEYEDFAVTQYQYSGLTSGTPPEKRQGILYRCKLF